MDNFLTNMYGSRQTVFTSKEIAILLRENDLDKLKAKLSYYVRTGKLIRLRRGIFAKNAEYEKNELAVRILTPAYVGFETVLAKEGVIFQYYESVFVASYVSRKMEFGGNRFTYRKLKNEILLNKKGLIDKGMYLEASRERAFLDMLYLFGDYYFDNLRNIDWNACLEIVDIYGSVAMKKRLNDYRKKYAE